jgi:excisionase family DNA binding protein
MNLYRRRPVEMLPEPAPVKLFTTAEIASAMGVSPRRVRELIKLGQLGAVNIGLGDQQASWRISQAQFDTFLEARKVKA